MSGDDYGNRRGGGGRGGGGRGGRGGYGGRGRAEDSDKPRYSYVKNNSYDQDDNDGWDDDSSQTKTSPPRRNDNYRNNYSERNDDGDSNFSRGMGRANRGGGSRRGGGGGGRNFGEDDERRGGDFGRSKGGYGDDDDDSRRGNRGMGRGRRGGRFDNNDSENGYGRRRNEDDDDGSPSRDDDRGGRRRGGGGTDGDGEDKDDKPRERYIPPDPIDDEDVMFGSGITSGINFSKYDNIRVKVTGENTVKEIYKFEEAGLRDLVLENIKKSGYKVPTPIQKYALPTVMMGRDLMACAQTGSGKTAAFLIPIINTLLEHPTEMVITSNSVEPQAVIMSPTRELTIQIFNEARKFSHGSILKVALAYGGTATFHQANIIMKGCHILVATPGRLNDFVSRGRITFSSVRFFVLDEADRMLDMGFKPEIEKMLNHETMVKVGDRQTMMFSATFPEEIQKLAWNYLHNYLFITVGIVGGACSDVQQMFYEVSRFDKKQKLQEILTESGRGKEKTLVFVEQKRTADFIAALLSENGFPTTSIHGDRLQSQREMALNDFKTGRMPTLVATAVAARGLDIKNVAHVINFDLPNSIEEYVHRIGRTGRVGNRGKATSFYDPSQDTTISGHLVTILKQTNQEIPDFLSVSGGDGRSGGFSGGNDHGFGGRDVRRGSSKNHESSHNNNIPVALEEEEEW